MGPPTLPPQAVVYTEYISKLPLPRCHSRSRDLSGWGKDTTADLSPALLSGNFLGEGLESRPTPPCPCCPCTSSCLSRSPATHTRAFLVTRVNITWHC